MTKDTVVFDLDGTLSNSDHRVHLAQAKMWDEFHSLAGDDPPHLEAVEIAHAISDAGHQVIILTGRSERYRLQTMAWLSDHGVDRAIDQLIMRPDGDRRSDVQYKTDALVEQFGSIEAARERIILCVDDRDRVVEGFRSLGIPCWQVRPGSY